MQAVGIDLGTTSICGVAINVETGLVEQSLNLPNGQFLKGEPFEKLQDPIKIVNTAIQVLTKLLSAQTVAIGVTGQMHGIVYLNKSGKAVSPLYTWQDERGNLPYRSTTYAKHLNSYSGYGNVTDFYNQQNGVRPAQAVGYCTIHDYFVMQLCGLKAPVIHATNAASFGCFDLENNRFTYPYSPKIVTDYSVAGLYRGVPVGVAIGDNQASVFSTLANENSVLLNVGTGSQVSVITKNKIAGPNLECRPYFENKYLACGAALCGGRAFALLKIFYAGLLKAAGTNATDVYKIMDELAASAESTELTVDTRFAGTRADPTVCGSISGITGGNFTPQNLTLAFLQGMALELYNLYAQMGVKRQGIVGSGNGIRKNKALQKAFENKFRAKMLLPNHLEEAAFGAALFGLISAGVFQNAAQAQKLIRYKA